MIDKITSFARIGAEYIQKHPQLMMTILLIVVIPAAFLISGQQFLEASKTNQERLEKDRIGTFHDVFTSYVRGVSFDQNRIQSEIERISALNTDIVAFTIARQVDNTVNIIADLNRENIGTVVTEPDIYRTALINENTSFILPRIDLGTRYWLGVRAVRADDGSQYFVMTIISLEGIDKLFAEKIMTAYYWLIALLGIVFYLLFRHVRLIDYAYLYQETKKANEMKDLFTNMIAHELRAPLTAIRGYASMIRENKSIDDITRQSAERIEDSSGRLVLIINDLLDVARIQSGKMSVSQERVACVNSVATVLDSLRPTADMKQISLRLERPTREVYVIADEKRLYQVFTNIINNAIKYTEQGQIAVSIEEKNARVEIRVKDTGVGISSEDQKGLFAPFFRANTAETNKITGTGLGMWVTKQLVDLMGGSISVESIRGVGTHVIMTLPLSKT